MHDEFGHVYILNVIQILRHKRSLSTSGAEKFCSLASMHTEEQKKIFNVGNFLSIWLWKAGNVKDNELYHNRIRRTRREFSEKGGSNRSKIGLIEQQHNLYAHGCFQAKRGSKIGFSIKSNISSDNVWEVINLLLAPATAFRPIFSLYQCIVHFTDKKNAILATVFGSSPVRGRKKSCALRVRRRFAVRTAIGE